MITIVTTTYSQPARYADFLVISGIPKTNPENMEAAGVAYALIKATKHMNKKRYGSPPIVMQIGVNIGKRTAPQITLCKNCVMIINATIHAMLNIVGPIPLTSG